MKRFLRLARRDIPARIAIPWVLLGMLSPLWFNYLRTLCMILSTAMSGVFTGHESPSALGNDFLAFWPAGHILVTPQAARIYHQAWFSRWQLVHLGFHVPAYLQYFYPPPSLLLPLLIAPFPFMPGFLIWTVLLTAPAIILLRRAGLPWPVIAAGLASIACMYNMLAGQLGFLTGAMFIAGLFAIDTAPNPAGALLGALVIKPQAGLLGPIALLARGRYRAIGVGACVVAAFCLAVTAICGWAIWVAYFSEGLATSHRILVAPFPTFYEKRGASVFWMLRSFGASVVSAGIAQAASALGAALWCWHAWRRPESDRTALVALTVSLTLLVTPYGYTTDMCGFSLMVAWLAWERGRLEVADVLLWMWPALCPVVSTTLHVELTPVVLLLGAIRAWKRLGGRIGTETPACYPATV